MAGNRNPYVQRSISQTSPQSPYKKRTANEAFRTSHDVVCGRIRREFSRRHRTLHTGRENGAKSAGTNHTEKRPKREAFKPRIASEGSREFRQKTRVRASRRRCGLQGQFVQKFVYDLLEYDRRKFGPDFVQFVEISENFKSNFEVLRVEHRRLSSEYSPLQQSN